MKFYTIFVWLTFLICLRPAHSTATNLDSLWNVWEDASEADTSRLAALHNFTHGKFLYANQDSAAKLANIQYEFAKKINNKKFQAVAKNTIAITHWFKGELDSALYYFKETGILYSEIGEGKGLAATTMNVGSVFLYKGEISECIIYYSKSLKLNEALNNELGIAQCLSNIGTVHLKQKDYDLAIEYLEKAIKKYETVDRKSDLANAVNNLGIVYHEQDEYEKALEYYQKAYEIRLEINEVAGINSSIVNIGLIQLELGEYDSALLKLEKATEIFEKNKDMLKLVTCKVGVGRVYLKLGEVAKAETIFEESLAKAEELGIVEEEKNAHQYLHHINEKSNPTKALFHYQKMIELKDSLINTENSNELAKQHFKHEYELQATADSIRNIEKNKVLTAQLKADKAEKKAQKQQNLALLFGLALTVLFGIFAFNRFRKTRKQKNIIEKQKEMVDRAFLELEEKNREITDSIAYAKRLQDAILPSPEEVSKSFDNFILFEPKDVVSGDFYWFEKMNDKMFIAAADCTGHGVPGALVSVVCSNSLNRALKEFKLTKPSEILDKTRELVIETFAKRDENVKDGMDIALCALTKDGVLEYAGAHNPLWIIRNGDTQIEEIKANKQPVGNFENALSFTNHTTTLAKGDSFYLFSDGFADQFGGDKGKKFKTSNFKKLLASVQDHSLDQQKDRIELEFHNWKGSLEQLDDLCIIGVKV